MWKDNLQLAKYKNKYDNISMPHGLSQCNGDGRGYSGRKGKAAITKRRCFKLREEAGRDKKRWVVVGTGAFMEQLVSLGK